MPVCLVGGLVTTCKDCGEEKSLDEFYMRPNGKPLSYCKECAKARTRSRYRKDVATHAHRARVGHYRRKYGITVEQFDEMYEKQGGKCFICEKEEATHVDHCHDSGDVRALLCNGCNSAIGLFKEDPDTMIAGAMYVLMHQGPTMYILDYVVLTAAIAGLIWAIWYVATGRAE